MFYLKFKVNDQNYVAACVFQADGHVKSAQHLKDNGAIICMFSTADLEIKNVPNPLRWYHLSAICPEDI